MNNSADELQPTMDEYQLIWVNTNDAIFILRNDGAIIQANPALTDILGWRLEEIEGYARPPFFMEDFTVEDHQKQLDVLRSGESIANYETQRKHKDGTIKDVLASYRSINKDHILAVAMYKDITEEKITKHKTWSCGKLLPNIGGIFAGCNPRSKRWKLSFANPAAIKF